MIRFILRGPLACFARPESPDRFSYPIPTGSALRGIISAIYDHPGVYADVRQIAVLAPIRYARMGHVHAGDFTRAHRGTITAPNDNRRTTVESMLVDPVWWVEVRFRPEIGSDHPFDEKKVNAVFTRRLAQGEYYYTPSLGLHELRAILHLPQGSERPIQKSRDFGMVIHDMDYRHDPPLPHVYHAVMTNGVIPIPSFYDKVLLRHAEVS